MLASVAAFIVQIGMWTGFGLCQRENNLRSTQALNAFFIIPPGTKSALGEVFQTHPSLEHRLARLEAMERGMNSPLG